MFLTGCIRLEEWSMTMQYNFRPAELQILRKRIKLPTSRWAEEQRVLKKGPSPGPWKNSRNPAMIGIMDTCCLPWVRRVVIMKGVQTGATDGVFNFLGREGDYSNGSDSALVVLADEKSVKKHSENRLQPMVNNSTSLARIKSSNPNDFGIYRIRLSTGFQIEIGWATSEISLASETYRIVIRDEFDKYKSLLNAKEAEKRTTTMEDKGKKIIDLSNPGEEGGPIDEALQQCDVICDFKAVCPDCGGRHVMSWDNFRWPGQVTFDGEVVADPKHIRRARSAWYECPDCRSRWDDFKRDHAIDLAAALPGAGWEPRVPCERPYAVGFHFPAWISKFTSMSVIVAEWLEAQDNPDALRAWYNKQAGLPYSNINAEDMTDAAVLHQRRYTWKPDGAEWIVPQRACILIGSVDVQDNRLEVKTIALARGMETWIIDRSYIHGSPSDDATLSQLDIYLTRLWPHESGAMLKISAAGVDTGGHFTQTMYKWLRQRLGQRIFGVKGASDPRAPLTKWSLPNKKQRRQVPLLLLNTTIIKNDIHDAYKKADPGPGYIHIPETLDYNYCEQLCSEKPIDQRDKRGNKVRYWVKRKPNIRNEALDLLVYAYGVTHSINPAWDALEAALQPKPVKSATSGAETVEKPAAHILASGRRILSKGVQHG
jgi:phage terminase large subunit GpA-like protein